MEKKQAEIMAQEVIKSVVDMLSQKRYEEIGAIVEMDILSMHDVREDVRQIRQRLPYVLVFSLF